MNQQLKAFNKDLLVSEPIIVILDPQVPLKDMEKQIILQTLKRENYNRTHTAKVLGIGLRTLQRKLKKYNENESRQQLVCLSAKDKQPQYII